MYGVAATRRRFIPQDAGWLPADAWAHLDFTQGHYYHEGVQLLSAMLANVDTLPTSDGLLVNDFSPLTNAGITATGGFEAELISRIRTGQGMSIVVEMESSSDVQPDGLVIHFGSATDDLTVYVFDELGGSIITPTDSLFSGTEQTLHNGPDFNRYAFTLSRNMGGGDFQWAASNNGDDAYSMITDDDYDIPFTSIPLFAADFAGLQDVLVRFITFYDALEPSALPALSDLPTA